MWLCGWQSDTKPAKGLKYPLKCPTLMNQDHGFKKYLSSIINQFSLLTLYSLCTSPD